MKINVLAASVIALAVQSSGAPAASSDLREAQQEALACSERLLRAHAVIDCEPFIFVVGAAFDQCGKSWLHAADVVTPKTADLGSSDKVGKLPETPNGGLHGHASRNMAEAGSRGD